VLLSAAGDDYEGEAVLRATEDAGVDVSRVARLAKHRTGAYVSLLDSSGELVGAVADMEVIKAITPELLDSCRRELAAARGVIADTNLSVDSLLYLSRLCFTAGVPLFIEPVSVSKAAKLKDARIAAAWIAPNRDELRELFGISADELLFRPELLAGKAGCRGFPRCDALLLSLGAGGAAIVRSAPAPENPPVTRRPALKAEVEDVNGAGDALLAGFAAALYREESEAAALEYGLAAAALTAASSRTVPPGLSRGTVEGKLREG
jgi:pseudouridine kinase